MLAARSRPRPTAIQSIPAGFSGSELSNSHSSTNDSLLSTSYTSASHTSWATHAAHNHNPSKITSTEQPQEVVVEETAARDSEPDNDHDNAPTSPKRKSRVLRKVPPSSGPNITAHSTQTQTHPGHTRRWSLFAPSRRSPSETLTDLGGGTDLKDKDKDHRDTGKKSKNKRGKNKNEQDDQTGYENDEESMPRKHVPTGPPPSAFNSQHKARFSRGSSLTGIGAGRYHGKALSDSEHDAPQLRENTISGGEGEHAVGQFERADRGSAIDRLRAQIKYSTNSNPTSTPIAPVQRDKPLPTPPSSTIISSQPPPLTRPTSSSAQSEQDELQLAESQFGVFNLDPVNDGIGIGIGFEGHGTPALAFSDIGHVNGAPSDFKHDHDTTSDVHWQHENGMTSYAYAVSEPHLSGVSQIIPSFSHNPMLEMGNSVVETSYTPSATEANPPGRKLSWTQRIKRSFSLTVSDGKKSGPEFTMVDVGAAGTGAKGEEGEAEEEGGTDQIPNQPYTHSPFHYPSRIRHSRSLNVHAHGYAASEPDHSSGLSRSTSALPSFPSSHTHAHPSHYNHNPHRLSPIADSTRTTPVPNPSPPTLNPPPPPPPKKLRKRSRGRSLSLTVTPTSSSLHLQSTSHPNLTTLKSIITPHPPLHNYPRSANASVASFKTTHKQSSTNSRSSPDLLSAHSRSPPSSTVQSFSPPPHSPQSDHHRPDHRLRPPTLTKKRRSQSNPSRFFFLGNPRLTRTESGSSSGKDGSGSGSFSVGSSPSASYVWGAGKGKEVMPPVPPLPAEFGGLSLSQWMRRKDKEKDKVGSGTKSAPGTFGRKKGKGGPYGVRVDMDLDREKIGGSEDEDVSLPPVRSLSPLEINFEERRFNFTDLTRTQSSPNLNVVSPSPPSPIPEVPKIPHAYSDPSNAGASPNKSHPRRRTVLSALSPLTTMNTSSERATKVSSASLPVRDNEEDEDEVVYMKKGKRKDKERRSLPLLSLADLRHLDVDDRSVSDKDRLSSHSAEPTLSHPHTETRRESHPSPLLAPPSPTIVTRNGIGTGADLVARPSFLRTQSNRRWTLAVSETPEDELVKELDRLRSIGWGLGFQGEIFRMEDRNGVSEGEGSGNGWKKEEMDEWLVARKALLVCREIVRTEKTYKEGMEKLQRGETIKKPSPLLLQYLPALISASETFSAQLSADPSAWGVSLAFINTEEALTGAFVAWSGVVGEFFGNRSRSRSKTRLARASRLTSSNSGMNKSATASPARTSTSASGSTTGDGPRSGGWRISMGSVSQLLASSTEASLVRRTRYFTGGSGAPTATPSGEKSLSVHDLAIQPTQRVMRYVLLYKDLLSSTPISSPARAVVERALEGATRLAQRCNRAQDNAAFLM